jgi:signal transduction histidine kinase
MARLVRIAPWAHDQGHAGLSVLTAGMAATAAVAELDKGVALEAGAGSEGTLACRRIEVQARTEERRSLSRLLHDEIGQSLTALSMKLAMLRAHATGAMQAQVVDAHKLLEKTLEQVQRLSRGLYPSAVEDLGLVPALRSYIQRFTTDSAVGLQVKASESQLSALAPTMAVAIFRSVEALLSDLPPASSVLLTLTMRGGALELEVRMRMAGRTAATAPDVSNFQEQVLVGGGILKRRAGRNQALITARFPMTNQGKV